MLVYPPLKPYVIKKPKVLLKDYVLINVRGVHQLPPDHHKNSNTEISTDHSNSEHYSSPIKKNSILFHNTQIKEVHKEKVNNIIHNLLSFNHKDHCICHYKVKENKPNVTHNTKKTILKEILLMNASELQINSFEGEKGKEKAKDIGIGRPLERRKLYKDIKDYEIKKRYSNVLSKSTLNEKTASIEWMFNLRKEKRMCFNKKSHLMTYSLQQ